MLVQMKVSSLTVDPFTNMPIVVLKDADGRRSVPIWIGLVEASAIATELERIQLARPMTHDLMKTLLESLHGKVDRVEVHVHDLKQNTFYATLFIRRPDDTTVALDARPSDAIALALRTGAEILVAEKVIDRAKRIDLRAAELLAAIKATEGHAEGASIPSPMPSVEPEVPSELLLESLSESAFGKWKM
jgi:bifunctional DNase/RNase